MITCSLWVCDVHPWCRFDDKRSRQIEINKQSKRASPGLWIGYPHTKIRKDMTIINWDWKSQKIHNWIRGLSPYPGMSTIIKEND